MIQFIKTRDVKSPLRNVAENAGIDFYIPENNDDFIHDLVIKKFFAFCFSPTIGVFNVTK